MSYTERNKGKLVLVATKPYTLDPTFDDMYPDYFEIGDKLYRVEFEIEGEEAYSFSDVKENEDGSIDFHTMHYNGGGHWIEAVEWALNKQKEIK